MRYSLMLQLVVSTSIVLVVVAAFFAWLQNRPQSSINEASSSVIIRSQ
ncbi:hypothetical protein [Euhalothece natronophila]|nr:hypothetical protein [Euhalothece natronophila]